MSRYKHFKKLNKYVCSFRGYIAFYQETQKRSEAVLNRPISREMLSNDCIIFDPISVLRISHNKRLAMYKYLDNYVSKHGPFKRILELGGASGHTSWMLSDICDKVVCVDNSRESIEIGKLLYPEVIFVHSDMYEYMNACTKFDLIVMSRMPCRDYRKPLEVARIVITVDMPYPSNIPVKFLSYNTALYGNGKGFSLRYPLYWLSRSYISFRFLSGVSAPRNLTTMRKYTKEEESYHQFQGEKEG